MSTDMMIICEEDNSCFGGGNDDEAFFIDETGLGLPNSEFGEWFSERYCGSPGVLEQLHGIKKHRYIKLLQVDIMAIRNAMHTMRTHSALDKDAMLDFLTERIGKHISTENW